MKELDEVSAWAREIVLKRVVITTIAASILSFLVSQGIIPDNIAANVDSAIGIGFTLLVAVVGALSARAAVTPADPALAPVSKAGEPLTVAAAVVEAAPVPEPAPAVEAPADVAPGQMIQEINE